MQQPKVHQQLTFPRPGFPENLVNRGEVAILEKKFEIHRQARFFREFQIFFNFSRKSSTNQLFCSTAFSLPTKEPACFSSETSAVVLLMNPTYTAPSFVLPEIICSCYSS
jgi:hypothetical protein